jgi:hypothetical protein
MLCLIEQHMVILPLLHSDFDDLDLVPAKGRVGGGAAPRYEALGIRWRSGCDI